MPQPSPSPRRRRRKRPHYWLRRLVALLLLLTPLSMWRIWRYIYHDLPITPVESAPRVVAGQPVYIMLLGVDERAHDTGRSDTIVLLRLDPDGARLDMINIPRDTRVLYQGGTPTKINATYAYGGASAVTQTVSDLLQIPRPYYVKLNFESFEAIVDRLGGIDLYVDKHYVYNDPLQKLKIDLAPGQQHMDGTTALKFVRLRYDGAANDDISRIKRQQQFLQAVKQKITSPAYWPRVPGLLGTLRQYIATNIPEGDQIELLTNLYKARNHLQMTTLPGVADDATGDWKLNGSAWSEVVQQWTGANR